MGYRVWGIGDPASLKLRRGKGAGEAGRQLVFKSGKQLLIGSQRAEELEEAIRSIMESN